MQYGEGSRSLEIGRYVFGWLSLIPQGPLNAVNNAPHALETVKVMPHGH